MFKAFKRQKHPEGAEWFISTNGPDFFYTPYPFPTHLFRGQNQHFEPCAPSLNRGLEKYSTTTGGMAAADQGKGILRIAKSHWFARELSKHPAIIWAEENRYTVNRIGLAQHYELETSDVDLSHEFDVAFFLAHVGFQGLNVLTDVVGFTHFQIPCGGSPTGRFPLSRE